MTEDTKNDDTNHTPPLLDELGLTWEEYVRKPFVVTAVLITRSNIDSLAPFIGELENDKGKKSILVDPEKVEKVHRVYPGFYLTRMGPKLRCYSKKVFNREFAATYGPAQQVVELMLMTPEQFKEGEKRLMDAVMNVDISEVDAGALIESSRAFDRMLSGIGWALYSGDGREINELDGAPSVHLTDEEMEKVREVANAAWHSMGDDLRIYDLTASETPVVEEVIDSTTGYTTELLGLTEEDHAGHPLTVNGPTPGCLFCKSCKVNLTPLSVETIDAPEEEIELVGEINLTRKSYGEIELVEANPAVGATIDDSALQGEIDRLEGNETSV